VKGKLAAVELAVGQLRDAKKSRKLNKTGNAVEAGAGAEKQNATLAFPHLLGKVQNTFPQLRTATAAKSEP
jgi:hypothetical protein